MKIICAIDQSTSGTKALLLDESGKLFCRSDRPHRQILRANGWLDHDLDEIYRNVLGVVRDAVEKAGIDPGGIAGIGLTNQRETAAAFERDGGAPACNAIVWQCGRARELCGALSGEERNIREATGLPLSPYFTAAKFGWMLENVPGLRERAERGEIGFGTIDSYLIYRLTGGKAFKTDYSNASRTQLFNIRELRWDPELCRMFGVPESALPEACDSNALFGETDLDGFLPRPVPIHSAIGDSHAALFGQGCHRRGLIKATYGTGSSVMLNVGESPAFSEKGAVTSLAWGMSGKVDYVLEGNINYTGAAMKWVTEQLGLLASPKEAGNVARGANPEDATYLVPAYTGLGAPYWNAQARAVLCGMTLSTGKAEIVKAAEESIAYQIADIVEVMRETSGLTLEELRVDGGPTRDEYLMQFQSDILGLPAAVPDTEELSGIGAGFAAGIALGIFSDQVFQNITRRIFRPEMSDPVRERKRGGWKKAVRRAMM